MFQKKESTIPFETVQSHCTIFSKNPLGELMKRVSNTNTRSPETTSTSGTSLPPWLEETKDMILTSPEWNVCLDDIYTSLKELMRKDHIQVR